MGTGAQTAWLDVSWLGEVRLRAPGLCEPRGPRRPRHPPGLGLGGWARAGMQKRGPWARKLTRWGSPEGKGPGNPGRAGRGSTGGKGSPPGDRIRPAPARGWGSDRGRERGAGWGPGDAGGWRGAPGLGAAESPSIMPTPRGHHFWPAPAAPTPPAGGGGEVAVPAAAAVSPEPQAAAGGWPWRCGRGRAGGGRRCQPAPRAAPRSPRAEVEPPGRGAAGQPATGGDGGKDARSERRVGPGHRGVASR